MSTSSLLIQPRVFHIPVNRRRFLQSMAIATAGFTARGALAEALTLTPQVTEGPYYPDRLPLDQDNDLLIIGDSLTRAVGQITHVRGRVLDHKGDPIRNALVELWQADTKGTYIHSRGANGGTRDANFQGYGKFLTASDGAYKFRTVKAGLYMGRTRHLHFGVTLPGRSRFTTQLFWREFPKMEDRTPWPITNARDSVLSGIQDAAQRASIIRTFNPVATSVLGEEETTWDIVMGHTPTDR